MSDEADHVLRRVAKVLDVFSDACLRNKMYSERDLIWKIRESIMSRCDLKCSGGPCYRGCVDPMPNAPSDPGAPR